MFKYVLVQLTQIQNMGLRVKITQPDISIEITKMKRQYRSIAAQQQIGQQIQVFRICKDWISRISTMDIIWSCAVQENKRICIMYALCIYSMYCNPVLQVNTTCLIQTNNSGAKNVCCL